MNSASKIFQRVTASPVWEGVIFPGIHREDPRALVYEADVPTDLKPYIQTIWYMDWSIPDDLEFRGIAAPIPCFKLMCLHSLAAPEPINLLLGVKDKGLILSFKGTGQSVGVDFRPGGFYPFVGKLGLKPGAALEPAGVLPGLPSLPPPKWNLNFAEKWYQEIVLYFQRQLQSLHPNHLSDISKAVEEILNNRSIAAVDEVMKRSKVSKRTLQRIFQEEVGLSVKEVIRIARFNRTIREMNGANIENIADFALASGYFDQPHMLNDFKKLVAESPRIFKKYW